MFGLVMLQMLTAKAITTPEPSPTFTVSPTLAVRALSVADLALPSSPITFTSECIVDQDGALRDCIDAEDGGTNDIEVYRKRLMTSAAAGDHDPVRHAARFRLGYYRVALTPRTDKRVRTVLIRETVSAADAAPTTPAVPAADGEIVPQTSGAGSPELYPAPAIRSGAQSRVAATCRVLADRSLLCRDAKTDLPPFEGETPAWRNPMFDPLFERATVRTYAAYHAAPSLTSGGGSVGHEGRLRMNWRLPED